MMKKKEYENLLDIVPIKNDDIEWRLIEDDIVQIIIKRDSWMHRFVRRFKNNPESSKIDLDIYGSRVWILIDGKRDVHQIAENLKQNFGDDIEPLYERLGAYINILKNNNFIKIN